MINAIIQEIRKNNTKLKYDLQNLEVREGQVSEDEKRKIQKIITLNSGYIKTK